MSFVIGFVVGAVLGNAFFPQNVILNTLKTTWGKWTTKKNDTTPTE